MKLSSIAAQQLIEELTKSRVVVEFTGKSYSGYPRWNWDSDEYDIIEVKPIDGIGGRIFYPFSIKINDEFISPLNFPFAADPRYRPYMKNLCDRVFSEIDFNINLRLGKWDILSYLTNLEFNLKEIRGKYRQMVMYEFTDNEQGYIIKELHIEISPSRIYENLNLNLETPGLSKEDEIYGLIQQDGYLYVNWALTRYWDEHLTIIEEILKIIEVRKSIIEKTDDYARVINELPPQPNLQWTKTDTDLLELIIALYETGAIQNATKDLTQKEAIQVFSDFFGKEIKDQYKKLNSARNRKKEDPGFILKIQKALEAYYQCLNEKN